MADLAQVSAQYLGRHVLKAKDAVALTAKGNPQGRWTMYRGFKVAETPEGHQIIGAKIDPFRTFTAAQAYIDRHYADTGEAEDATEGRDAAFVPSASQLELIKQCKRELAMNFEVPAAHIIESYANQVGISVKQMEKAMGR